MVAGQEDGDEVITESSATVKGEVPEELLSFPPKVDSKIEVLHEKVTKQIIKEGHGQKPSKYSTCFCECHVLFAISVKTYVVSAVHFRNHSRVREFW